MTVGFDKKITVISRCLNQGALLLRQYRKNGLVFTGISIRCTMKFDRAFASVEPADSLQIRALW